MTSQNFNSIYFSTMEFTQCTNLYPIDRSNKGTLNNKSYLLMTITESILPKNNVEEWLLNKHSSTLFLGYLMCLKSVPLNIKWPLKNINLVLESP